MNLFRNPFRSRKNQPSNQESRGLGKNQTALSADLSQNLQALRSIFTDCADIIFRSFSIGEKLKAALIYMDGLSNIDLLDQHVLSPLMQRDATNVGNISALLEQKISVSHVKEAATLSECVQQILAGNPVVLVDGQNQGLSFGLAKTDKRGIEEPSAESMIRGPREGFIETVGVNAALLRRKIRSPELKFRSMKIGTYSQTETLIAYMEGIADKTLVEEVLNRLQRIEIDGVLESSYLEEMIEDNPSSLFPQILSTERPDVAAANLLEGRVIILVDGTPFVLIVPISFYSLLQSPEDFYQRYMFSTSIRWLRYGFLLIALLLPSLYVAVLTFHQEMIPSSLFYSIAKSREEIPFPVVVEALIMEVTFEALREAGVRLPKQVGAAVSIVGALVIGQAAVSAGIVSSPMVMVVAITGIASFMIPRYNAGIALRMLRFPLMLFSGMLGLLGLMLGVITVIVHLCTLRSFGIPYLAPMAPMKRGEIKDVLMRAPLWKLNARPHLTGAYNEYRQSSDQKPGPQKGDE